VSLNGGFPIRPILVALAVIPALYLVFNIYQAGNALIALTMLIVICLGALIYLSDSGYTYRYLFPGLLGFGLFVIFPIAYMVFLSFTKHSSQNLLYFDRALAVFLGLYFSADPHLIQFARTIPARWRLFDPR
jgi:maltose/maltodextrin transport system permease protein